MEDLYSPWRLDYILSEKENGCIFCIKPQADDDKGQLILKRGKYTYIIMNLYPYNNGHLMIVPFRHVARMQELSDEELSELGTMTRLCERVLTEVYHPDGLNIGMNLGEAAGAGVADHLHLHVVPRWSGDTNFISALGNTRVIPEKMENAYKNLKIVFDKYES